MSRHKTVHTETFTHPLKGARWAKELTDERDDYGQQVHDLQSLNIVQADSGGYWFVALCNELSPEEEVYDA